MRKEHVHGARDLVCPVTTWRELAESAASCTRCDLYKRATATVFGEGRKTAAMVLVGEQPGDQEDKQGRPFVGRPDGSWTGPWMRPASSVRTCT